MVIIEEVHYCDSCPLKLKRIATNNVFINGTNLDLCQGCFDHLFNSLAFFRVKFGIELFDMKVVEKVTRCTEIG